MILWIEISLASRPINVYFVAAFKGARSIWTSTPFKSRILLHIRPHGANPGPRHVHGQVEVEVRSGQVKSGRVKPGVAKSRPVLSGQVRSVRSGQVRTSIVVSTKN